MKRLFSLLICIVMLIISASVFASCNTIVNGLDAKDVSTEESSSLTESTTGISVETTKERSVTFEVTPSQNAILFVLFGDDYYSDYVTNGGWDSLLEKVFTLEESDIWNSSEFTEFGDVLDFFITDDRYFRFCTQLPPSNPMTLDVKDKNIDLTPAQDAIINEIVDARFKYHAGYWKIWFYKLFSSSQIKEWNSTAPSTRESIKQFLDKYNIETKIENKLVILIPTEPMLPDSLVFSFPSSMPAKDIYAEVKKGGWVVFNDSFLMAGGDIWDEFYEKVSKGESASVLIAKYSTLDYHNMSDELYQKEKDKYPMIFLTEIVYDGRIFTQMTRYSIEDGISSQMLYKYIIHSKGPSTSKYAIYENHEEYMLVNKEGVTCEQVWNAGFSANFNNHIDFCSIYSNITELKEEYAYRRPKE